MTPEIATSEQRQCSLGLHTIERAGEYGKADVLQLSEPLATPAAEQAIRVRAEALAGLPGNVLPPVRTIERVGDSLRVTSAHVDGIRLSTLLEHLSSGSVSIPDDAMIELLGRVIRAVATLHAGGPTCAHGAIAPERMVLAGNGVVLTDGLYATALEGLHWNRDHLWRTFGLTLPTNTPEVRLDQRSDVAELAGVALALLLRRPLVGDEYPRAMPRLLQAATARLHAGAAIRQWLQQAFQLDTRTSFSSAVAAHRTFTELTTRYASAMPISA